MFAYGRKAVKWGPVTFTVALIFFCSQKNVKGFSVSFSLQSCFAVDPRTNRQHCMSSGRGAAPGGVFLWWSVLSGTAAQGACTPTSAAAAEDWPCHAGSGIG